MKSLEHTTTGRPSMRPNPPTLESAGVSASMPGTSEVLNVPISRNESGSSRRATRSRALSAPAARRRASRSGPPMPRAVARRAWKSFIRSSQAIAGHCSSPSPFRKRLGTLRGHDFIPAHPEAARDEAPSGLPHRAHAGELPRPQRLRLPRQDRGGARRAALHVPAARRAGEPARLRAARRRDAQARPGRLPLPQHPADARGALRRARGGRRAGGDQHAALLRRDRLHPRSTRARRSCSWTRSWRL